MHCVAIRTSSYAIASVEAEGLSRGVAAELANAGVEMQRQLKAVFGDPATFEDFTRRAKAERELQRTMRVTGGSDTHRRGAAADFDPAEAGAGLVTGGPVGAASAATGGLARLGKGVLARRTAAQLAPTLLTQGTAPIDALLRQWQLKTPLTRRYLTGAAPAAAASLFDQF